MIDKFIILYHFVKTKLLHRKNRTAIVRRQLKHTRKHVQYVQKHTPYYQNIGAELSSDNWQDLPLMNKQVMMEHFDTLNTLGISKNEAYEVALQAENSRDFNPTIRSVTVGLSSGTSGNRGIFLVSQQERNAWAGTILAKMLPRSIVHAEKIAFFLRANSNLYGSVGSRRIQFVFYDLLTPIKEHITRLNEQRPGIIVAPPSMLRILAHAKKQGTLLIEPRRIISVAEVLDRLDQRFIETQFNQKTHQVYQSTEGLIACTCHYGTLHLNEDIILIEKEYINKEARRFVPIITDFSRKTQPIIRYRLDDILVERKDPCPCGSPFTALEQIEGRYDDLFLFPHVDTTELTAIFPDYISRAIIRASENILEYYAVQQSLTDVHIALKMNSNQAEFTLTKHKINEEIQRLCTVHHVIPPTISFKHLTTEDQNEKLDTNKRNNLRKLKRVERHFKVPTEHTPYGKVKEEHV